MSLSNTCEETLGIPKSHIKIISEEEALCLVHSGWVKFITTGIKVPEDLLDKFKADENLLNFFSTCNDIQSNSGWQFLTIRCWNKKDGKLFRFLKPHEKTLDSYSLTYSQLVHYVTKTNYKNLWEQAWKNYHTTNCTRKSKNKQKYNDSLQELLNRLYKTEKVVRDDGVIIHIGPQEKDHTKDLEDGIHPNLLEVFCAVETSDNFLLICENETCTLQDCLKFSPFILSGSTIHSLFVIYQLIQVLRSVHNAGLFMGPITLSSIKIKENLWIQVLPSTWKCLYSEAHRCCAEKHSAALHKHTPSKVNSASCVSSHTNDISQEPVTRDSSKPQENSETDNPLPVLVQDWVDGNISNYDYLIALNKLAGRQKDNPRCHYVMPWIMDFSAPEGGWRDLSKSKFRLNKGDKQLDLIYESAVEASGANISHNSASILQDSAITVPHHTSEVLADITYYVYKARRMPKSFLCQHVRQKWVPAEYPATIERLQEWTPDECIPEFYSDPTIFYSVHPDLNDLGVPWWCESAEDFIQKHRNALEGYHVSERLHHWIDLVFGYKLTGTVAVKSKNVCLPLVDCHTSIHNHGMIQLFSQPHPHKLGKSIFLRCLAPKTFRNVVLKSQDTKDSGDDDTSSESLGKPGFLKGFRSKSVITTSDGNRPEPRPENQTIVLPKDFNPLSTLSHLESLITFQTWAGQRKQDIKENRDVSNSIEPSTHHYQVQDMLILGCLISEIAISSHFKTLPQNISLQERYNNILKLLRLYKQDIPRSLRNVIQLLLQVSPDYQQQSEEIFPYRYPPISASGLPLPSPHQLLLPHIRTIPFPIYFHDLHNFLVMLNNFSSEIKMLTSKNDVESQRQIERISEKKVCYAAEQLQKLLPSLNQEGIELITPYLQEMFESQHTALLSTWHLFGIVAQALGPQQTCRKLLAQLTRVFETDNPSPKHLKLYHRSFLLQIIVGLGLHNFLVHFTTILIEAIGGCKDYSPRYLESDCGTQKAFSIKKNDVDQMPEEAEYLSDNIFDNNIKLNLSDELQHEITNDEDNEIFDTEIKYNEEKDNDFTMSTSIDQKLILRENQCSEKTKELNNDYLYLPCNRVSETDSDYKSDLWNARYDSIYSQSAPNLSSFSEFINTGEKCAEYSTPEKKVVEMRMKPPDSIMDNSPTENSSHQNFNVSDVSAESMVWLAHRLGPVLSARYLTRNLLRMLTLCYDSSEKREIIYLPPGSKEVNMLSVSCRWLKGDINAFKVLDCLSRIASLYGEQFIIIQYIKHIADLLHLCRKKVPATLESGLHGAMALLQHIIPYISDSTLMDHLQDIFIKDILHLVLRLISSLRLIYPGGGKSRAMVTLRILDVIYTIGLRIGFEMTRKHLSTTLQKFFSCFDKIYNDKVEYRELCDIAGTAVTNKIPMKEQALVEMRQTFTPEMAFLAYIPFCKLAGGIHMERTLKNDELIRHLCLLHDRNSAISQTGSQISDEPNNGNMAHMTHNRNHSLGQDESFVSGVFGKNVNVVGNRLDVRLGDDSHLETGESIPTTNTSNSFTSTNVSKYEISLIKRKMDNCQRHLKGNWLAYWGHETGRSEKDYHFDFKQIKLQTFTGHAGAIRSIEVLDNENSFLTSSKDKTVKLWSLRSCGDGSSQVPCQWTYNQHRKSVFAVSFLNSLRLVGSCDSTVHLWDPFLGSCIKQLEPTKGSPITVLEAMPAPSTTFLAATTNSTVRFLDARTCRYMHEFKVNVGTTGLIRSLAVSPNGYWLAVGHSTGMLSVLDVRTGLVIGTWLGHEGEVLQLKAFNNSLFVTSSLDHSLTVWEFEDTQAKCNLKGPMEPVTSICFYGNEVISGTTGNRIGQHSSTDKSAVYTSTRLRSDTFKGVLTTMALLPLNRLLLLGTDNGNVVLLC